MNISEMNTFTSTVNGGNNKINHKLTCGDNCLIYLLTCKCCGKQYFGETTGSFRYRWNNYKDNDRNHSRKESCIREHLFKHFNSMGHNGFLNNVTITLIDKSDSKNPKKREDYWRRTLKTYSPFGLNVEDSVWPIAYSFMCNILFSWGLHRVEACLLFFYILFIYLFIYIYIYIYIYFLFFFWLLYGASFC